MSEPSRVIVHVLNGFGFGGVENLCLQLIKNAPPNLRHVLVNMNPPRVEMKEAFLRVPGLRIVDCGYTRETRMSFVIRLAIELKRARAHAVLIYPFGVHVFVALSAWLAGVTRTLVHAGNPPPVDPIQRGLWRSLILASHPLRVPIKSCSASVDRRLRALAGTLPRGSEPVPNGVSVDEIERLAAIGRRRTRARGPRAIGMVARLNSIKDHETLLRAFCELRQVRAECELWLIGDGERRLALEALARDLGVDDAVVFWGARSDVHELLGQLEVFAFSTTRDEGFGIALAEAMAARVPIVASDVEACREVLDQGAAGRLVAPSDPRALAHAIVELLDDREQARSLSDTAFARARAHFDIGTCADRYYRALSR